MKEFLLGLLMGAALVYWSGQRSEVVADAVSRWIGGAADNYRSPSDFVPGN
jgi:hypothetical protein